MAHDPVQANPADPRTTRIRPGLRARCGDRRGSARPCDTPERRTSRDPARPPPAPSSSGRNRAGRPRIGQIALQRESLPFGRINKGRRSRRPPQFTPPEPARWFASDGRSPAPPRAVPRHRSGRRPSPWSRPRRSRSTNFSSGIGRCIDLGQRAQLRIGAERQVGSGCGPFLRSVCAVRCRRTPRRRGRPPPSRPCPCRAG